MMIGRMTTTETGTDNPSSLMMILLLMTSPRIWSLASLTPLPTLSSSSTETSKHRVEGTVFLGIKITC